MPSSLAARTTPRSASTPRRWPSTRGRPRAAAQRPFPSMMIATCNGPSVRSGPSVAGAAAFGIGQSQGALNGEDFFFFGRKQLIDFRYRPVGRLLHVGRQTLLIVLGDLVILLQFLDRIEAIAPDMPNGNPCCFRVFVRDFHKLLAALLIELRNSQAKHLSFCGRTQAEIG